MLSKALLVFINIDIQSTNSLTLIVSIGTMIVNYSYMIRIETTKDKQ